MNFRDKQRLNKRKIKNREGSQLLVYPWHIGIKGYRIMMFSYRDIFCKYNRIQGESYLD